MSASSSDESSLNEISSSTQIQNSTALACTKIDNGDCSEKCLLCNMYVNDPFMYGDLYRVDDVVCHYFCLLFSSNLLQNGNDYEGILGFCPSDIKKEMRRGSRLKCSYCREKGATIGCHLKSCRKAFHLPCGLKNGSMHQYFGRFLSFCLDHRPSQTINSSDLRRVAAEEDSNICPICYEPVLTETSIDTLWAPCCKKRWFHRCCLQRQALAQGYFFRCPMCNNKDIFKKEMGKFGLYIPDMDAAWEREPQAYQDLLHIHNSCDAPKCKCPFGRKTKQNTGSWRLLRCNACGSQGTHIACSGLKMSTTSISWRCTVCTQTFDKVVSRANASHELSCLTSGSMEAGSSSSNSSTSTSSTSSTVRRPPQRSNSRPRKKRKSSPEVANKSSELDVNTVTNIQNASMVSNTPNVHTDTDKQPLESRSNDLLDKPGPSLCTPTDEDVIVTVDDSDDEVEVVEVVKKEPDLLTITENNEAELMTNEGKKIKVIKVPEDYHNRSGTGGVCSRQLPSVKEEPQPPILLREDNHIYDIQKKPHSSERLQSPELYPSSRICKTSPPKIPAPNTMPMPMFPFPHPAPVLFYYPVKTPDGQSAIQPMMIPMPAQYAMHQQELSRRVPSFSTSHSSPDIVTLED